MVLYEFSTKMTIIGERYSTSVLIYENRAEITREGLTSLPKRSTIQFEAATAVTYGKTSGRSWISFAVPGAYANNQVVTAVRPGTIVLGGTIPYKDQFSVVSGLNDNFEKHYEEVKKIFDNFKASEKSHSEASARTTIIQQDGAVDKLKKLKELYELGIVSESEYEDKRQKLLSEI